VTLNFGNETATNIAINMFSGDGTVNDPPKIIFDPNGTIDVASTTSTIAYFDGDIDVTGIIDPIGIVFDEQPDHPVPEAVGKGIIWVKNNTPNRLFFTDDAGINHDLLATSSPTFQNAYDNGKTIDLGTGSTSSTISIRDFENFGLFTDVAYDLFEIKDLAGNNYFKLSKNDEIDVTLDFGDANTTNVTINMFDGSSPNPKIIFDPDGMINIATTETTVAYFDGDVDITGIIDPTAVIFDELVSPPKGPENGKGIIWVKNDDPNRLFFTDNIGTDHDLLLGTQTIVSTTNDTPTFFPTSLAMPLNNTTTRIISNVIGRSIDGSNDSFSAKLDGIIKSDAGGNITIFSTPEIQLNDQGTWLVEYKNDSGEIKLEATGASDIPINWNAYFSAFVV
jgi:hypothetical protein